MKIGVYPPRFYFPEIDPAFSKEARISETAQPMDWPKTSGSTPKKDQRAQTYRRNKDGFMWHWRSDCSKWPVSDYHQTFSKPTYGEFCPECQAKTEEGNSPSSIP
jgi:hypothetical protein